MESWHQCMASECGRRASDDHVRCISCTAHLKRQALAVVKEIRSNAVVAYVGRSNSPERRLLQHFTGQGVSKTVRKHPQQRDRLSVIHWTGRWREAAMVEDHLIKHSSAKPGLADLLNSPAEGWGRFSGPWNCVYVNWAAKDEYVSTGILEVNHLLWPLVAPSELARTDFVVGPRLRESGAAGAELAHLDDRRSRFHLEIEAARARSRD
jgi:predicted GIY-YIG superfamily endonuclease